MSTPAEEVYVVEQLSQDEMGLWWKPTFTHTNLAVALGKLESMGSGYIAGREATRVRVYRGTSVIINRPAVQDVHRKLLHESEIVSNSKAEADAVAMIEHVMRTYVPVDGEALGGDQIPFVEKLRARITDEIYDELVKKSLTPLEILHWDFEFSSSKEVEEAEDHLLQTAEHWVPQGVYKAAFPKEKKPAMPPTVVIPEEKLVDPSELHGGR